MPNNWTEILKQPGRNMESYAKTNVPAVDDGVILTVEDEAQGLARRIRKTEGGQREHSIAVLHAELRTLNRNVENGYGASWGFRIAVLKRCLELLGAVS